MWRLAKPATQNMPAIVTDSDDTVIAICPAYSTYTKGSPSYEERNKTAHLIAASPELLQALDTVMNFIDYCLQDGTFDMLNYEQELQPMIIKTESIIKKAKGETTP